jgi:hypothetical protein
VYGGERNAFRLFFVDRATIGVNAMLIKHGIEASSVSICARASAAQS